MRGINTGSLDRWIEVLDVDNDDDAARALDRLIDEVERACDVCSALMARLDGAPRRRVDRAVRLLGDVLFDLDDLDKAFQARADTRTNTAGRDLGASA